MPTSTNVIEEAKEPTLQEKLGAKPAIETLKFLNLLIYGPPGAGKTYFGGTAQDHKETTPVLVLDIEGGSSTLRHRKDVDVVRVTSFKQLVNTWAQLDKAKDIHYKTVVLDSLTELQKLDMNDIMASVLNKDPDRDPDVPSQREWGKSSNHIREIVRRFRDLPCNVIFTSLDKVVKDDDSGAVHVMPSLPGKLANEVPGFIDIVGYLYTDIDPGKTEVIRRLLVQPTRKHRAKDRTSALGQVIENPSVPIVWDLIKEKEASYK
jgi:phage nucleotide-binding protein